MIRIAKSITNTIPSSLMRFLFCDKAEPKKKSYIMPEKPNLIEPVQTNKKLSFKNGRYLIYMNKQNLSTPYLLDLHYTVPLLYVGYLIANNPFYLTFPAALPMMFIFEAILLLRWIEHKSHHKRHIERIYLLENGSALEFIFANKIRRYMKSNEESLMVNIFQLYPKYDQQIKEGRVTPYRGVRFPADINTTYENAVKPTAFQYGWTFRDRVFNNYVLPAKFQYADWHVLTKVLNGVPVVFDKEKSEGQLLHGNYPTIEEEEQYQRSLQKKAESQEQNQSQPQK